MRMAIATSRQPAALLKLPTRTLWQPCHLALSAPRKARRGHGSTSRWPMAARATAGRPRGGPRSSTSKKFRLWIKSRPPMSCIMAKLRSSKSSPTPPPVTRFGDQDGEEGERERKRSKWLTSAIQRRARPRPGIHARDRLGHTNARMAAGTTGFGRCCPETCRTPGF